MFEILLESSFRSIVAAASVGLLLALLRVKDAAFRHTAWKFVLAATIAMPLVVGGGAELQLPMLAAVETSDAVEIATSATIAVAESSSAATGSESETRFRWVAAYLAIAFAFLVRIAIGYGAGIRIARASEVVDREHLSESLPGVRYRSSPRFTAPMTFGWIFPVVLLPGEFRNWNDGKQRAVLAHEHAHVRRRDFLTNLIASLARAAYWMNPLAWWLERHLAHLAEQAADEIAAGRDRRTYAEFLIEIAKSAGPNRIRGVAMTRHSGLGKRIENLSNGRSCMKPSTRTRTWTLALGILALVGAASCMTPTRAASGSSFTGVAQEEAESRAVLEQELRELEADLERARVRRAIQEAVELRAERSAQEVQRQTDVQREFERQRALEELELERSVVRQQTLEELRRLRDEQLRRVQREVERVMAERDRIVVERSIEDQIREAERRVSLAREQLLESEERLRMLVDQLETQESN